MKFASLVSTLVSGLLLLAYSAALAQEPASPAAKLGIELNKLEPEGSSCRTYLLFDNATDSSFSTMKLDIVVFDKQGIVATRLALDAAPLKAKKTSLKIFDINGIACDHVGRLLLNDVTSCKDQNGDHTDCLGLVALTAKGAVPFGE